MTIFKSLARKKVLGQLKKAIIPVQQALPAVSLTLIIDLQGVIIVRAGNYFPEVDRINNFIHSALSLRASASQFGQSFGGNSSSVFHVRCHSHTISCFEVDRKLLLLISENPFEGSFDLFETDQKIKPIINNISAIFQSNPSF
eukprot:c902_g1_i1.p1 GENE.c902_g1_i1~~c902_g1_i1.p1  ORF type:complete len:150 (-),score=37.14 c902_g1_i1:143-571(-)